MEKNVVSFPDPSTWHNDQVLLTQSVSGMGGGERKYRLDRILGGGVTSVVWKATQLDESGASQRVVALKVLRPDVGQQYVDGLYNEQSILRLLWQNLKDQGVENPAIPEVYDFSPTGTKIRYIAMEFVSGVPAADLVGYQSRLPARVRTVRQQADEFIPMFETLLSDVYAEPDVDEKIKKLAIEIKGMGEKINESLTSIIALIENMPDSPMLLSEKDIVTIGLLTAQVFQVLEDELKRSYLDFQLKNIYFDVQNQQLKILDWNVVSQTGAVDILADIFRLASGLFFLLTKVEMEKPCKLDDIRKFGGLSWSDHVSQAVRMVLERGLVGNPEKPYTKVYDWNKPENWEMLPLSASQTIGNAFETILFYWKTDLLRLQILIQTHLQNGLLDDATAVLQIAQKRLVSENQVDASKYADKFEKLKGDIDQLVRTPYEKLERAKDWLGGNDRERARQAIEIAYQGAPHDLMICRWKVLIDELAGLKINKFTLVWQNGNLQDGMQALAEKRWLKAQEKLGMFEGLTKYLVADAKLNQMFEAINHSYQAFNLNNETTYENFKEQFRQLSDIISTSQLTYKDLVLHSWPEYEEWRMYVKEYDEKQAPLRETRQKSKEVTYG